MAQTLHAAPRRKAVACKLAMHRWLHHRLHRPPHRSPQHHSPHQPRPSQHLHLVASAMTVRVPPGTATGTPVTATGDTQTGATATTMQTSPRAQCVVAAAVVQLRPREASLRTVSQSPLPARMRPPIAKIRTMAPSTPRATLVLHTNKTWIGAVSSMIATSRQ